MDHPHTLIVIHLAMVPCLKCSTELKRETRKSEENLFDMGSSSFHAFCIWWKYAGNCSRFSVDFGNREGKEQTSGVNF